MEGLWIPVLDKLKDPMLILVFLVIAGLFHLLLKKEKSVETMQGYMNTNIKESTAAMARLVTMVEGLVHGRRD